LQFAPNLPPLVAIRFEVGSQASIVHTSEHETRFERIKLQEPAMTKSAAQAAALALSVLMTLAIVAGMNGLATTQYAMADSLAMAPYGQAHVAVQHVTIVGRRANA
jgi:hypothetical protein